MSMSKTLTETVGNVLSKSYHYVRINTWESSNDKGKYLGEKKYNVSLNLHTYLQSLTECVRV